MFSPRRNGIHLDGDPDNADDMKKVATYILEILKNPEEIQKIQNKIIGNELTWDEVSNMWLKLIHHEYNTSATQDN